MYYICPGCVELERSEYPGNEGWVGSGLHRIPTAPEGPPHPVWSFNGSVDSPTLSPSVLTKVGPNGKVCHSLVRDGMIQFLSDCNHSLAGQTVPVPEFPAEIFDLG